MRTLTTFGLLLAGLFSAAVQAGEAQLIRNQPLLAAPSGDAAVLAELPRATPLDIVGRQGGWVKIRAQGQEGWVRLLAIRRDSVKGPGASEILDLFKTSAANTQTGRVTAVAGLRNIPTPKPSAHALILTIGDYTGEIPPLRGVRHDADAAVLMANGMGVPEENITVLRDQALTLDGLNKAFDDLYERLGEGDQVFVYYSGHGTRLKVDEAGVERCAEALVSVDAKPFLDSAIEAKMRRLAEKTRRLVSFFDACHSGGVTTRSVVAGDSDLTAKFWTMPGQGACAKPTNALARLAGPKTRSTSMGAGTGTGSGNFVHIASARADEVSLDEAKRGGIATHAWMDCLNGEAYDTDGSGGLSVEELQRCAQDIIDVKISQSKLYTPHHITVAGNTGMVFGVAAGGGADSAQPGLAFSANQAGAFATLKDLFENRDDRRRVSLTASKDSYRIRRDRVGFELTSSHGGYVYILMVGSDGSSFDMLFPNKRDQQNLIRAGETLSLPRAGWDIRPGGPVGQDHLLAIVSDVPRDFGKLGMRPSGPFSTLPANTSATRDIQMVIGEPDASLDEACKPPPGDRKRALEVVDSCSDAYGAALLTINEVE